MAFEGGKPNFTIPDKYKSRKFLMPIIFAILVIINKLLDDPIEDSQLTLIAGAIVSFVLGEALVDYGKERKMG